MTKVLLVTSLGCTPCLRVKRVLNELQAAMPQIEVEEVEFSDSLGTKLAIENSIAYPPAVFVDGVLIAKGKIDSDKMLMTIRQANVARA